jgi:hypothetical protein
VPESPTESARAQGAQSEPPLGQPVYDEIPSTDDQSADGEHVVITPQTAGSAGAAHTQES